MEKGWVFLFLCGVMDGGVLRCTDVAVPGARGEVFVTGVVWGILDKCRTHLQERGALMPDVSGYFATAGLPEYERRLNACAIRLDEICQRKRKEMDIANELRIARTLCREADPLSSFCQKLCEEIGACIVRLEGVSSPGDSVGRGLN